MAARGAAAAAVATNESRLGPPEPHPDGWIRMMDPELLSPSPWRLAEARERERVAGARGLVEQVDELALKGAVVGAGAWFVARTVAQMTEALDPNRSGSH